MILLRQRCYSWDNGMGSGNNVDNNKQGMSTGKKIALGVGGTVATAGAAFAGARRGLFGNNARIWSNVKFGNVGAKLQNTKSFKGLGNDMIKSAGANLNKGMYGQQVSAKAAAAGGELTKATKGKIGFDVGQETKRLKDIWSKGGKLDMNTENGVTSFAKRVVDAAK